MSKDERNKLADEIELEMLKINSHESKEKALKYLHRDWLAYKKDYKKTMNWELKETFIEYLEREIPHYIENKDIDPHKMS